MDYGMFHLYFVSLLSFSESSSTWPNTLSMSVISMTSSQSFWSSTCSSCFFYAWTYSSLVHNSNHTYRILNLHARKCICHYRDKFFLLLKKWQYSFVSSWFNSLCFLKMYWYSKLLSHLSHWYFLCFFSCALIFHFSRPNPVNIIMKSGHGMTNLTFIMYFFGPLSLYLIAFFRSLAENHQLLRK